MKIYTKTGDSGTTGLFGGPRVLKSHARISAYGTVDELNATIGFARALLGDQADSEADSEINGLLGQLQEELFVLGADLATPVDAKASVPRIREQHILRLEAEIDRLEGHLEPLTQFILPGGSKAGAALHNSRTVCRRAERGIVALQQDEAINDKTLAYVNRLSDFLFVLSRFVNKEAGQEEEPWTPE